LRPRGILRFPGGGGGRRGDPPSSIPPSQHLQRAWSRSGGAAPPATFATGCFGSHGGDGENAPHRGREGAGKGRPRGSPANAASQRWNIRRAGGQGHHPPAGTQAGFPGAPRGAARAGALKFGGFRAPGRYIGGERRGPSEGGQRGGTGGADSRRGATQFVHRGAIPRRSPAAKAGTGDGGRAPRGGHPPRMGTGFRWGTGMLPKKNRPECALGRGASQAPRRDRSHHVHSSVEAANPLPIGPPPQPAQKKTGVQQGETGGQGGAMRAPSHQAIARGPGNQSFPRGRARGAGLGLFNRGAVHPTACKRNGPAFQPPAAGAE